MSRSPAARLAQANIVLVAGFVALQLLFIVLVGDYAGYVVDLTLMPVVLLVAVLGATIVSRNAPLVIGAGMALVGLIAAIGGAAAGYATYALSDGQPSAPGHEYAAWLTNAIWFWAMGPMMLFLLLAPSGTLPSRRWRPVLIFDIVILVTLPVSIALNPGPLRDFPEIENPVGLHAIEQLIQAVETASFFAVAPAAWVSTGGMVVRFRRSSGVERQQLKWLAAAAAATFGVLALTWAWVLIGGGDAIWPFAFAVAVSLPPIATAIAVLRYRLYDIDRIVSRSLSYAALTAGLGSLFIGLVAGFGWVARTLTGQGSNEVAVAATTLIVAALFQPARRRIQSLVDRRFYRSRYDAGRIVEAFQSRLRDQTDIDAVRSELAQATHLALRPSSINVWIRPGVARNDLVARHPYREGTP